MIRKQCMGEFPMFPGWLFFEEKTDYAQYIITAYGSDERQAEGRSENREHAIAECMRNILEHFPK